MTSMCVRVEEANNERSLGFKMPRLFSIVVHQETTVPTEGGVRAPCMNFYPSQVSERYNLFRLGSDRTSDSSVDFYREGHGQRVDNSKLSGPRGGLYRVRAVGLNSKALAKDFMSAHTDQLQQVPPQRQGHNDLFVGSQGLVCLTIDNDTYGLIPAIAHDDTALGRMHLPNLGSSVHQMRGGFIDRVCPAPQCKQFVFPRGKGAKDTFTVSNHIPEGGSIDAKIQDFCGVIDNTNGSLNGLQNPRGSDLGPNHQGRHDRPAVHRRHGHHVMRAST